MEGSEARLVNRIDVRPKVKETGDSGEGAGFLLVECLDSKMNRSHSLSVSQILECSSTKQESNRLALEPGNKGGGMFKQRKKTTILPCPPCCKQCDFDDDKYDDDKYDDEKYDNDKYDDDKCSNSCGCLWAAQ